MGETPCADEWTELEKKGKCPYCKTKKVTMLRYVRATNTGYFICSKCKSDFTKTFKG